MTEQPTDPPAAAEQPTGVPAADDARAQLDRLDDTELEGHVAIYEDAHRRLQEGLADLDER